MSSRMQVCRCVCDASSLEERMRTCHHPHSCTFVEIKEAFTGLIIRSCIDGLRISCLSFSTACKLQATNIFNHTRDFVLKSNLSFRLWRWLARFACQVAPGMLITFLQKGLAYVGIEEHLNEVSFHLRASTNDSTIRTSMCSDLLAEPGYPETWKLY